MLPVASSASRMTTSVIPLQADCSNSLPTSVPKRRRRAATNGATEDCHACRKTRTVCDRRRPYCSQCLGIGKDCSGYRTNLTWGVGVASRGKLRGLSLPVVGSSAQRTFKVDGANAKVSAAALQDIPRCRKRPLDISRRTKHDFESSSLALNVHHAAKDSMGHTSGNWPSCSQAGPHDSSQRGHSFHVPQVELSPSPCDIGNFFLNSTVDQRISSIPNEPNQHNSIQFERTSPAKLIESTLGNGYSAIGLSSAKSQNPVINPLPFPPSSISGESSRSDASLCYNPSHYPSLEASSEPCAASQFWNGIKESSHRLSHQKSFVEIFTDFQGAIDSREFMGNSSADNLQRPSSTMNEPSPWTPMLGRALDISNAPLRVRSLLDFYDKAICPVLVAFDGTSNPYRSYVMPLALQDRGLQSAIAALAANNLRMRRLQEVPCLKGAPSSVLTQIATVIGQPSVEEQIFKANSIEYLNTALARKGAAQEDSVLATLLILCLFHVCDSGFSKFKTQLTGVQKLLRLRGSRGHSDFVGWVEMFFTWFDVMTSAVNDRETQIHGDSPALVDPSHNLGSLEQFSGCEGRLFKLLARLGRLNLLSQGREVRAISKINVKGYDAGVSGAYADVSWAMPDGRHEFWHEWHELRERLFTWTMDEATSIQSPGSDALESHYDLLHISESFRFSALLYTERLAYPTLHSSSGNLQDLVSASICHISHIGMNSCMLKFLLWPLFVTGTECVLEEHRDLIRALCGEIQKESGFYNNVSSLEVLERVWKDGNGAGGNLQAFRWRDAMPRVDGEYIVI